MVESATFRMFHRASPARRPDVRPEEPIAPAVPTPHIDESLASQFSQDLRARRRAARTDMRQSGAWVQPEPAQPAAPSLAESIAFVSASPADAAPVAADEPAPVIAEPHPVPQPVARDSGHHAAAYFEALAPAEEPDDRPPLHDTAFAEPEAAREDYDLRRHDHGGTHEVAAASVFEAPVFETAAGDSSSAIADDREARPEPDEVHPAPPVPIDAFLGLLAEPAVRGETVAPFHSKTAIEEPWPIEAPSTLRNDDALPIAPPAPIEPETVPSHGTPAEALSPRHEYRSDSLDLDYRLLGLANPLVCTVIGKLGDATPTEMSIGRSGIYRPDGFRPAPWSGFAYDISPDGRTGLALGTRVLTARGELPVEALVPGDSVLALRGPALLPILWIGHSLAALPPVEIAAGAFGPGRPSRPLRVGADHPIFMETMPVAARDLVNGETIRNLDSETVELFHIDVGAAEVLLAEGIPLASGCR